LQYIQAGIDVYVCFQGIMDNAIQISDLIHHQQTLKPVDLAEHRHY
jgi:hypothetical protein